MTDVRRALVTGGSGFIGTHLVRALLERGVAVTVVSRSARRWRPVDERARFLSVTLGEVDLDELLQGVDVVYHLAWSTIPKTANDDPARDVLANIPMSLRLAEACIRAGVRLLAFVSTGGTIYGAADGPLDEDTPLNPMSSYGVSKLTVERYLALYRQLHGLNAVAFRPTNAYGPYQDPAGGLGAVTAFVWRVLRQEPIEIWGGGSVVRDFLYVTDLVDALVAALDLSFNGPKLPIFNVASGERLSLNELLDCVFDVMGQRVPVHYLAPRPFDVRAVWLSNERARQELGWRPRIGLATGIRLLEEWLTTCQLAHSLEPTN